MASSSVNKMLKELTTIALLAESAMTAEKSRVASIKTEAAKLFAQQYSSFQDMQSISNSSSSSGSASGSSHAELQVKISEIAFATENLAIARKTLERFLQTSPQKDQYYCRAKILLGLLIDCEASHTNGINSVKQRKLALSELMLALDVATAVENAARYKFIVFNISIACWKIVGPFLRADRAKNFIPEMNRVCSALESVDDPDKKWRINYLAATAICYADDKQAKESSDRLDKAIEYAEKLLSECMTVEASLSAEAKKCVAETESIMVALRAVEEREEIKNRKPKIDPDAEEGVETKSEPIEFPPLEGLAALGYAKLKELLNASQGVKAISEERLKANGDIKLGQQEMLGRLYSQRVHVNVPDFKKVQGTPTVVQSIRLRTLVQLQCITSGAIVDKDWPVTFQQVISDLEKAPASSLIAETFLDVSRTAWSLNQRDVAIKCCELGETGPALSPSIRVKLDLCKSIRIVADIASESAHAIFEQRLTHKQVEGYAASRRVEAIKLLERTLTMCTNRLEDNALAQEICIAIWNTALPLLQPHLRSNIHRAFQLAAGALEAVNSPLSLLRAQLHFELAKCEESADFLSRAKEEGSQALRSDYGSLDEKLLPTAKSDLDRKRALDHLVRPFYNILDMRSNVYDAPSDPEGQVTMMIQQIRESSSRTFQRDTLGKAMVLMMDAVDPSRAMSSTVPTAATSDPEVSLAELETALNTPRTSDYATFTMQLQQRVNIMASLASIALSLKMVPTLLQAVRFILSNKLDCGDSFMRPSLDRQIDAHFLLADCLVEKMSTMTLDEEQDNLYLQDLDARQPEDPEILEPRALGVVSKYASEDMQRVKRIIILSLRKGVELSASLKDEYGVQNGVIYFWNLHLHLFRNGHFKHSMPEVLEFLAYSTASIQALPSSTVPAAALASSTNPLAPNAIDERLKFSLLEGLSSLHEAAGSYPQAIEVSTKGSMSPGSAYLRKRIVELVSRQVLQAAVAGTPAGGKGGAKPVELPKFDNPFLAAYSSLAQSELPETVLPKEQVLPLIDKAASLMDTEVTAYLATLDWKNMTQEAYDQVLELQAEAWTRLTRAKIRIGDIHGSQQMAEKCMNLIAEGLMNETEQKKLSPRVWRWVSVCERYFGVAIGALIQPEGQDLALQCELRLAALRHFSLAADYAHRASKEDLAIAAAIESWNASIPLLDTASATVRSSLSFLQRQVLDAILKCKPEEDGMGPVCTLMQQLYLAIIAGSAASLEWDAALRLVNEAFQHVPAALQKPLWKWRVVAMSKKGKDVMAGLAKLKEGDASLQARVYAILARASSNPTQQLEAYRKTMDILKEDMERVDYMLETAQWLGSSGVPRVEIIEVVQSALDAIYEIEEQSLLTRENDPLENDSVGSSMSRSSNRSGGIPGTGKTTAQKTGDRRGSTASRGGTSAGSSRRGSAVSGSRGGSRVATREIFARLAINDSSDGRPSKLNAKQYEQALRALIMMSMLESNETNRREKMVELQYFLRRFLRSWQEVVQEALKLSSYAKIPLLERDAIPYESYTIPEENYADLVIPTEDELILLDWTPSDKFVEMMALISAEQPMMVPSITSFPSLPLTLHYFMWAITALQEQSMSKASLLLIGIARAVVMSLPMDPEAQNAALAMLHYRAVTVATSCGLSAEGFRLSPKLGRSEHHCTAYIRSFASKPIDAQTVSKMEESRSEQLCIFGFSSFTCAMTNVDPLRCGLEILADLTRLGQLSLSRSMALALKRDFAIKQWTRERLKATTILAQIDFQQGRLNDALAAILSCSDAMRDCGDGDLIAQHTALASAVYLRQCQSGEAKRILLDAIETLQTFSYIQIANNVSDESGSLRGSVDHSLLTPSHGPPASRGVSRGNKSIKQAVAPVERSLENLTALKSIVFLLLDFIVAEASAAASAGKDCRALLGEAMERCDKLAEMVILVTGRATIFYSLVLEKKASVVADILGKIHMFASGATGLAEKAYMNWMTASLGTCMSWLTECVDIRRGVLSQISIDDQSYTSSAASAPPPVPVPEDPKAKKGAPPVVVEAAPAPVISQTLMLSLPVIRQTAAAEVALADLNMVLSRLQLDDISALPVMVSDSNTAVEKYLIETTQPDLFLQQDFAVPPVYKAMQLAGSATQLLSSAVSGEGAFNANHMEARLLYNAAVLARGCGGGAYNVLWRDREVTPPSENERAETPALSKQFLETRTSLQTMVIEALQRSTSVPLPVPLCHAVTALIDSYGNQGADQAAASSFILVLQSLRARQWLQGLWERALNPTTEVAASLVRLKALETSGAPSTNSVPQIAAEVAYLQTSSSAWRRLSIATNPATIIARLPTTAFVALTLDPASRSMYVAAGVGSSLDAAGQKIMGEFCLPGTWVCDRLELEESSRRILQALLTQHKVWTEDCSKFVNIYGESVSADQDLQGNDGKMGGKLLKTERALEERLRALMVDLETVLPLLSLDGKVGVLLAQLEATSNVVLVVDPLLAPLPIDGMSIFTRFGGKVSRDFSVHMLGHRLQGFAPAGVAAQAAAPAKGAASGATTSAAVASLSATSVQTVVDPHGDDPGSRIEGFERESIDAVYSKLQSTIPGATKWVSISQGKGTLSVQDWQLATYSPSLPADPKNPSGQASRKPVGLFVYSTGRLGSMLSPTDFVATDLEAVLLLVSCDLGMNDTSYRRQNVLDNVKSPAEISLENPLALQGLGSLSGLGSSVIQRWASTLASQKRFVSGFWTAFGVQKANISAAVAAASLYSTGGAVGGEDAQPQLKPWVRLSRVVYGLPMVTYGDA